MARMMLDGATTRGFQRKPTIFKSIISMRMPLEDPLNSANAVDPAKLASEPLQKIETIGPPLRHKCYLHIRTLKCELINLVTKTKKQNSTFPFSHQTNIALPKTKKANLAITKQRGEIHILLVKFRNYKELSGLFRGIISNLMAKPMQCCNYNSMLHLFKPKNYRKTASLLDNVGLNNDEFKEFQLQQIASNLRVYEMLFPFIREIIPEMKLSPFRALKIALFYLHIFHLSKDNKIYQQIIQLLHQLQVRVHALIRAKKSINKYDSADTLSTSKEFLQKDAENVAMDLSSILLSKIVIPLISFQQKLICCNDLYQKRGNAYNLGQCQTWSCMNLLRKIVDIGSDIESLGRYFFKQSANAVLCLMKIINYDIQCLYKRIVDFFRRKIIAIKIIIEDNPDKIQQIIKNQRIDEFLMMNEELEVINQKLRILYNGRYFIHHLVNNYIYLPALFTENEHIDLFYKIKQHRAQQAKKNKSPVFMHKRNKTTSIYQVVENI